MEIKLSNSTTRKFYVRCYSGFKQSINKMLNHSWEDITFEGNGFTVKVPVGMLHPTIREATAKRVWEAIKE